MASSPPLDGKIALITGASQGIGAATALHLARLGAKVVINYSSNARPAEELVQKIGPDRAIAIKADAGDLKDIERLVDETLKWGSGKIDILIPNAAAGAAGKALHSTSEGDFDRVVSLNIKGPYFLVQVRLPRQDFCVLCGVGTDVDTESSAPHALWRTYPPRLYISHRPLASNAQLSALCHY